jgi:zinc transport system substrate-binding protein
LVDTLARDAGVATAVLDPIEGLTDETEGEDYLTLMTHNLDALRAANGCP